MNPNSPVVSIVLPTYNGAKFLSESIISCLEQSYTNWELIIVNDGSTDDSQNIISAFEKSDPRISYIKHTNNKKLPAALNSGFQYARGKYLTWTSDDNYFFNDALEVMVNFLDGHPEIGLVYSDYITIDEFGQQKSIHMVKPPERLLFGCIVGPSFLYRQELLERTGAYSEDLFYVEDYDYWLRASVYFKFAPLHQTLYAYRVHKKRLTSNQSKNYGTKILTAKERSIHKIRWVDRDTKTDAFLLMARNAREVGNLFWMYKFILYAVLNDPNVLRRAIKSIT